MIFPYTFASDGICINGPLSTSTSFYVALNFAAEDGIIIEFQDLRATGGTYDYPIDGVVLGCVCTLYLYLVEHDL